ncbi:MAG: class I SAM-dependent methyltransferase [Nitrospirota bacterium]
MLQTVEHYEMFSPDYINLADEKINEERIWCQGEHKLPAFKQWSFEVRHLLAKSQKSFLLLDVGCGTGGFLRYAKDRGFDVYGFDSSQAQIDYARKKLPNVRKAVSPIEYLKTLGRTDLRFDIVTLWDVLEHIREPLKFLESVRSVLKPDGLLFVSVPNGRAMLWKQQLYSLFGKKDYSAWVPWEHVFYYSPQSLSTYLMKVGFHVMKTGAVCCYTRPLSLFELIRRMGFKAASYFPSLSPQIYVWSQATR